METNVLSVAGRGRLQMFAGRRAQVTLAVLVLASHMPFFVLHLTNLWRYRPQYDFFPVLLAAFAWLVWRHWPSEAIHTKASQRAARLLLLLGFACLVASVVLFSPSLGAVAAVLSSGGLLFLASRAVFRQLLPGCLLLWPMITPLWRLDDQVFRLLQGLTAHFSSRLLELIRIDHLLVGNVFHLADRQFFEADTCTGATSPLLLIAAGVLLAILLRRAWLHVVLLIGVSVFWSVAISVARVTLVVFVTTRWQIDLSEGWQHHVLSYSLVVIGFLLLLSTDRLLAGLLAPVLDLRRAGKASSVEGGRYAGDPLSRLWNRVIVMVSYAPAKASEKAETAMSAAARTTRLLLAGVPFGCLGVLQLLLLQAPQRPSAPAPGFAVTFEETWLPQRLGDWQRIGYQAHERKPGSDEGQFSHTWRYQAGESVASVSVDFPFLNRHEPTGCYAAKGWIVMERAVRQKVDGGPVVEVLLSKPSGETGHLLFRLFDDAGRPIEPRASIWAKLRDRIARNPLWAILGLEDQTASLAQSTLQVQQFIAGTDALDEAQRQNAAEIYLQLRRRLVERWRADAVE